MTAPVAIVASTAHLATIRLPSVFFVFISLLLIRFSEEPDAPLVESVYVD
jgi:hypothetical protein